eukprot:scaffold403_cov183-Ochromonas_danica.AAC.2
MESILSDGYLWAKTIPYTNQPKVHTLELDYNIDSIFNYSEFYHSLSPSEQELYFLPDEFQTGDIVTVNGFVRGVGSCYVVWLHSGLFTNPVFTQKHRRHPQEEYTVGAKRSTTAEVDLDQYPLTDEEWLRLRDLLGSDLAGDDYDAFLQKLSDLLQEKSPDLLEAIKNDGEMTFFSAITSLRFPEDSQAKKKENDEEEDADEEDEEEEEEQEDEEDVKQSFLQEKATNNASSYFFKNAPSAKWPRLIKRKNLQPLAKVSFMQCYLFRHLDEYGYAAPSALSMATTSYMNGLGGDGIARIVDLALLPPPLRQETELGQVLDKILSYLPKKHRGKDYIVDINTEGSNQMVWFSDVEEAGQYYSGDALVTFVKTREMFREHARLMKEELQTFLSQQSDRDLQNLSIEEVDDLLSQLLPVLTN